MPTASRRRMAAGRGTSALACNCRNTTGGATGAWQVVTNSMAPAYPNAWVRLQRTGTSLAAYYSTDGTNWVQHGWDDPTTVGDRTALPATVYIGLCQTAHNNDPTPPPPFTELAFLDTVDYDSFNAAYVAPAAEIVTEPLSQIVAPGGTATLSVSATGTPPLSYQWQLDNTNLSGATNATLALGNAQSTNDGVYDVVISNAYGSVTSSAAHLLVAAPGTNCVSPPSGLIAWWPGDGNANDIVGGDNGSLLNGATYAAGEVGQAFSFNGINAYVDLGSGVILSNAFTEECWIYPLVSDDSFHGFLGYQSDPNVSIYRSPSLWVYQQTEIHAGFGDGTNWDSLVTGPVLVPGAWNHVAASFDGTSYVIYVNGSLIYATTSYAGKIPYPTPVRNIGRVDNYFNGEVDEVSLYNRALSPDEIAGIYLAGSYGICPEIPPKLVSQPLSQSVFTGSNAVFSVSAAGEAPLAYQWQFNGANLVDGARISGSQADSLWVSGVVPSDAGPYQVVVTNLYGAATSAPAVVSVVQTPTPPVVLVQVYNSANDTGTNIAFTADTLIDSFTSPDIQFGSSQGWYWDPVPGTTDPNRNAAQNPSGGWGADFTAYLTVAAAGIYNIQLISDDGAYLFVNGSMAINNGGDRPPSGPTVGVYLNAGSNPFELQYRENGWGTQGVDLNLPSGVTFAAAPATTNSYTWVGPETGGDWFNPANWSPAGVPDGQAGQVITFYGGTINLSAAVTISGQFNWLGGALTGSPFTIAAGGMLGIGGSAVKYLENALTNEGSVFWGGGDIVLTNCSATAAATVNSTGAVWTILCDQTISSSCTNTNACWENMGTVVKSYGAGTTSVALPFCNIGGTIEVDQGTFAASAAVLFNGTSLAGNGAVTINGGAFTNQGSIAMSGGATLRVNASVTFADPEALSMQVGDTLQLGGDLLGNTRNVGQWLPNGTLSFTAGAHQLEAMSFDFGNVPNGYTQNFAYGTISLAAGAEVTLVDQFTNSAEPPRESVYATSLMVPSGAVLNLNGLHLYASLVQIAGTVTGGAVSQTPEDGGPLTLGTSAPGALSAAGALEDFTFLGRGGEQVVISVDTGSASVPSPSLNYAFVQLLDPSANVVAQASNAVPQQIVGLLDVVLPADGIYTVAVRAPANYSASTGNYLVAVWDATPTVNALVMNQPVNGRVQNPYSIDQWNFSAVAGQQVRFNLINVSASGLAFDFTGPNGWGAFTNQTSSSDLITLPYSGGYTITAHGTGTSYNIAYAFELDQTAQTNLAPGTAFT